MFGVAQKIDPESGEKLSTKAQQILGELVRRLAKTVLNESFRREGVSPEEANKRLRAFVEREMEKRIKELADKVRLDPESEGFNSPNAALNAAAEKRVREIEAAEQGTREVLTEWKDAVEVQQVTGKKKEKLLNQILKSKLGVAAKGVIKTILSPVKSFAVGKFDVYEWQYKNVKTGEVITVFKRRPPKKEEAESSEPVKVSKKMGVYLGYRRVVQDATKLVNVTNTTVLNSLPYENLPTTIKDAVEKFTANISKAFEAVGAAELAEQTGTRTNNTFAEGDRNLYNSPARGLIFNKSGKPNPEVLAAMYLALGDILKTDMHKMLRGYRSDVDIARMFNLQEHEVTQEMRVFAREQGMFLKTAANTIGKTILRQLGLTKRKDDDTSIYEYEALVSDLGNSAIELGIQQGLLELTSPPSNKIAKMFQDGEIVADSDAVTHFVRVKDVATKEGEYTRYTPAEAVTDFAESFESVIEDFPEAVTGKKNTVFQAHTC